MALGRQHETTEQSVRRCHDVHLTTRVERYAWQSTRNHLVRRGKSSLAVRFEILRHASCSFDVA